MSTRNDTQKSEQPFDGNTGDSPATRLRTNAPSRFVIPGKSCLPYHKSGDLDDKWTPEPNTGCWLWLGGEDSKGYGRVGVPGTRKSMIAHRAVYETHVGPIPPGMQLCHKCDTPACVNPAHMFLGTMSENITDMYRKGRRVQWKKSA
jgi:hypothetical protein